MTVFNLIATDAHRNAGHALIEPGRINSVIQLIKSAGIRRQAIRDLQSLSDAQLDDIGIPRYAIRDVVNGNCKKTADSSDLMRTRGQGTLSYGPYVAGKAGLA
ncbi:MAG: DUF1127 domain-containing protein [Acidiferrobacterales bacterium]|nr:DUF1127 domain-containing protein [Acidiferrobacterales bacterium]